MTPQEQRFPPAPPPFDDREAALAAARHIARQIAARAQAADRARRLPSADIADLRHSGLLGLVVPRTFGGSGLALRDAVAVQLILAQGSPSTAIVTAMQHQVLGHARELSAWPAARAAEFFAAAAGGALFNAVASEPALGSPSRGHVFRTEAHRDGEWLVVNGHKNWVTGGEHLTHLLVQLKLEDRSAVVLVEGDRPGLRWEYTWRHALSLRASDSHDLHFEDVRVPAHHLITQRTPKASRPANVWFPLLLAATYLGAALGARNALIRYALERVPSALGRPIATLPAIQRQIGALDYRLQAAEALLHEVAGRWDDASAAADADGAQRRAFLPQIAAAKTMALETATAVTAEALSIAGAGSLTDRLPLEMYFRDVRAGMMQPPAGDTALTMIGRHAIEASGGRLDEA